MKKTAVFLAALVTGAVLRADEAPVVPDTTSSYTVTVDFPYVSSYVFRGVKLADGSIQPSIKVAIGGAYAGVWLSEPLDSEFDREVDFYGGYSFALSSAWALDVGATIYHYPELDTSSGVDDTTVEGYVGLNGSLGGVTLGGYVYHDFTLETTTVQGSVGYGIPINAQLNANFTGTLGHVSFDGGDDYLYYGASVQFPYKISDQSTLTVGGSYANHDDVVGYEHDNFWANVGFTYTF